MNGRLQAAERWLAKTVRRLEVDESKAAVLLMLQALVRLDYERYMGRTRS